MFLAAAVSHLNNATGPTLEVHGILAWIIIAGAVSVALTGVFVFLNKIFKKFIFPLFKMGIRFEDSWPVLEKIAHDFKGNGHGTLQDQMAASTKNQEEMKHNLKEISTYAHDARHELLSKLVVTDLGLSANKGVLEQLKETVSELKKTREEIAGAKRNL